MTSPNSLEAFVDAHLADRPSDFRTHSSVVCLAAEGVPVIFVSDAFESHTGYRPDEVIGRSLSLLQGPKTEEAAVEKFRKLISEGEAGAIRITNYRKNGEAFVHECEIRPIRDGDGKLTHFVAIQRPC